jgi:hypothetical protein
MFRSRAHPPKPAESRRAPASTDRVQPEAETLPTATEEKAAVGRIRLQYLSVYPPVDANDMGVIVDTRAARQPRAGQ